ncbi:hypothetical protein CEXT_473231 [Caerostris extrusa]|uniref:Uncharacterized protein n=1 Tax=Caerostris extrusa TaxID=172846 RepID=A0AAV4S1E4_CAEEX|nr:hypothetical protein CEXT_473231 [Caerostris extrusa]
MQVISTVYLSEIDSSYGVHCIYKFENRAVIATKYYGLLSGVINIYDVHRFRYWTNYTDNSFLVRDVFGKGVLEFLLTVQNFDFKNISEFIEDIFQYSYSSPMI